MGRRTVAEALRAAGATVEVHDDHFPITTPDIELLTALGARDWILVSKDRAITRNPLELTALADAGLASFFLTSASLTGEGMAALVVQHLPRILSLARSKRRPFIAHITSSGVRVVRSRRDLVRRL